MRSALRYGLVFTAVTLLLAGGCSSDDGGSTTAAAGQSSSSTTAAPTTTVAALTTTAAPTTTRPAGPAVVEAAGWRLVITRPTAGATIGSAVDLCYTLAGPATGPVAFDVALLSTATGSPTSSTRADASVGTGSARLNLGNPDARFWDMTVQVTQNGQPINGLVAKFVVLFGSAQPAGCP